MVTENISVASGKGFESGNIVHSLEDLKRSNITGTTMLVIIPKITEMLRPIVKRLQLAFYCY